MEKKIKTILLFSLIGSFAVIDLTIFGLFTSLVLPSGSPSESYLSSSKLPQ